MNHIIGLDSYRLDTSTPNAFFELLESRFSHSIYSSKREYNMNVNADAILDFFTKSFENIKYRIFYGGSAILYNDDLVIRFRGDFNESKRVVNQRYDDEIIIAGHRNDVVNAFDKFDKFFADNLIHEHHTVDWIVNGKMGLEEIRMPIKIDRKFYPEMYPVLGKDPSQYIKDFINSTANVLILIGDAGLGKTALINEIILQARKFTQVVYDKDVMKTDQLFTQFLSRSLREEGGIMVLEDADVILSDRIVSNNETMSRILNMSDGVVDSSGSKFIFSANLKSKEDIDIALTRPGRCFDIVEFRNLSYDEAKIAAKAIGRELYEEKESYTVAEIFNGVNNRVEKKKKVGFI